MFVLALQLILCAFEGGQEAVPVKAVTESLGGKAADLLQYIKLCINIGKQAGRHAFSSADALDIDVLIVVDHMLDISAQICLVGGIQR